MKNYYTNTNFFNQLKAKGYNPAYVNTDRGECLRVDRKAFDYLMLEYIPVTDKGDGYIYISPCDLPENKLTKDDHVRGLKGWAKDYRACLKYGNFKLADSILKKITLQCLALNINPDSILEVHHDKAAD